MAAARVAKWISVFLAGIILILLIAGGTVYFAYQKVQKTFHLPDSIPTSLPGITEQDWNRLKQLKEESNQEKAYRTRPVPGDPEHFDPVASFAVIREYAAAGSEARLVSIKLRHVSADGTLNLKAAYEPEAVFEFLRKPLEVPSDSLPLGAGGGVGGEWLEPVTIRIFKPGKAVHVKSMGGSVSKSYLYENQGMTFDKNSPLLTKPIAALPDPQCALSQIWKTAQENGASSGAVARIEYSAFQNGYLFSISDTSLQLKFSPACQLIQK